MAGAALAAAAAAAALAATTAAGLPFADARVAGPHVPAAGRRGTHGDGAGDGGTRPRRAHPRLRDPRLGPRDGSDARRRRAGAAVRTVEAHGQVQTIGALGQGQARAHARGGGQGGCQVRLLHHVRQRVQRLVQRRRFVLQRRQRGPGTESPGFGSGPAEVRHPRHARGRWADGPQERAREDRGGGVRGIRTGAGCVRRAGSLQRSAAGAVEPRQGRRGPVQVAGSNRASRRQRHRRDETGARVARRDARQGHGCRHIRPRGCRRARGGCRVGAHPGAGPRGRTPLGPSSVAPAPTPPDAQRRPNDAN